MDETANSGRRVVTIHIRMRREHNDGINNARSTWEVLGGTHNNITILFSNNGVRGASKWFINIHSRERRPLWIYGAARRCINIESSAADDLFRLHRREKKNNCATETIEICSSDYLLARLWKFNKTRLIQQAIGRKWRNLFQHCLSAE